MLSISVLVKTAMIILLESVVLCNCHMHQALYNSDVHNDHSQKMSHYHPVAGPLFCPKTNVVLFSFRFNTHSVMHIKQGQVFHDGNVAEQITGLAGGQEQGQGPGEAAVSGYAASALAS